MIMIYDEAYDDAGEYTCDQQPGGFWRRCGGGDERPPQQESQCLYILVHMVVHI